MWHHSVYLQGMDEVILHKDVSLLKPLLLASLLCDQSTQTNHVLLQRADVVLNLSSFSLLLLQMNCIQIYQNIE